MIKKVLLIFVSLFAVAIAQNNSNKTLFTIANEAVLVKEFVRVYTKNNIDNKADFSKISLDEYLDLYEKFRLKVMEAESLGMDTVGAFVSELASYRSQLTGSYLSDRKATENLITEAYNRMKEEVNVSHILIFWPNSNPSKTDSAKVLNEILKIKKGAEKGSFDAQMGLYNKNALNKYPGGKQKYESGKLGYLTVFQTVYPFESAMYNTKTGTISEPVVTRFGYHLVQVNNKRPARGKMQTAHILVKSKAGDKSENKKIAEEKVFQMYNEIKSGKLIFEDAVKLFSEDKKTKYSAGKLPLLSSSEMLESFADAAFSIEKNGGISKPIKTKIGWHIIKRIKKDEIKEFDFVKSDLKKRVEKDTRSNVAKELMINDSKRKFGFSENTWALNQLKSEYKNSATKFNIDTKKFNQTLFTIGNKAVKQDAFAKFMKTVKSKPKKDLDLVVKDSYKTFKNQQITKYREAHLEEIDADFKNLMKEYHDGILLFELTNKEVWTKAVEDTIGLAEFFNANRKKYIWKDRIAFTEYKTKDAKTAKCVKKYISKNKTTDFMLSKLNKKTEVLTVENHKIEKGNDSEKSLKWKKGSVSEENNLDGSVKITLVEDLFGPTQKTLKETRGYVISDYQDYLESQWISKLRKKYPIKLDTTVFNSLVK